MPLVTSLIKLNFSIVLFAMRSFYLVGNVCLFDASILT